MKKGLKFTKAQLEELYVEKGLSLIAIGKIFGCHESNILYWLKKFDVERRKARNPKTVDISKEVLEDLYWTKGFATQQIADQFGIKNGRTILKKIKKYGIKSKTVSEALTKKVKNPFSGNLEEKAYFLGLRAGDFHAKWMRSSIRIQSTTTHLALCNLLAESFQAYGEFRKCLSVHPTREKEWFVYVDLHRSFEFLIDKPNVIPDWVLRDDKCFFYFLAAYTDCEGNMHLSRSHDIHARFSFRLRTGDKGILLGIKEKLESFGFNPLFYLDTKKGSESPKGIFRKDIYNLTLSRKQEVVCLIKKLLPFVKHSEKLRKIELLLKRQTEDYNSIHTDWSILKKEIKKELIVALDE